MKMKLMKTRLIRSLHHVTKSHQGGVVTIGNFDGVHLGHQHLVEKTVAFAKAFSSPSMVITFEPHPFEFFEGENLSIPRLTRFREKFCALSSCGIDYVLIIEFNQEVASISASDFVKNILHDILHVQHVIVGDDFHFGYKRLGDFTLLKTMGKVYQFTVEALLTVLLEGERISSSRIRQALLLGDQALAKRLLGHAYTLHGRIRLGDQLGRQLGFPTANIHLHRRLTPVKGIYTVYVHGLADHPLPGVANVGTRPTVGGTRTLLEVHLLNFNEDIYGRYVQVEFCEKLREEVRYPNLDLLKEQIAKDVADAHRYFQKQGVL